MQAMQLGTSNSRTRQPGLRLPVMGLIRAVVLLVPLLLSACGGGGGAGAGGGGGANGSGNDPGGGNIPPPHQTGAPRFAYVANFQAGTVSIYAVEATTGKLREN